MRSSPREGQRQNIDYMWCYRSGRDCWSLKLLDACKGSTRIEVLAWFSPASLWGGCITIQEMFELGNNQNLVQRWAHKLYCINIHSVESREFGMVFKTCLECYEAGTRFILTAVCFAIEWGSLWWLYALCSFSYLASMTKETFIEPSNLDVRTCVIFKRIRRWYSI